MNSVDVQACLKTRIDAHIKPTSTVQENMKMLYSRPDQIQSSIIVSSERHGGFETTAYTDTLFVSKACSNTGVDARIKRPSTILLNQSARSSCRSFQKYVQIRASAQLAIDQ